MKPSKFFISQIIFLLIISSMVFSQPNILWTETFGGDYADLGLVVKETAEGDLIVLGSYKYLEWTEEKHIYLIKVNESGDTLWTKIFEEGSERGLSLEITTDGEFIITGKDSSGLFLRKISSSGVTLWSKTYGLLNSIGKSVKETSDGGFIIVGDDSVGIVDLILIKTDSVGDTIWTRTYGGAYPDYGSDVLQTPDGGYVLLGTLFNGGVSDVWLIKTDGDGDIEWTQQYGGSTIDMGYSIAATTDGGFIITGMTTSFGTGGDIYLIKTNSSGIMQWSNNYGSPHGDAGNCVKQTPDGGYIIAGSGYEGYIILRTDSNGEELWTYSYGISPANYVINYSQGGYIIAGSYGLPGFYSDIILIRLSSDISDVQLNEVMPNEYMLEQNYPNPFNSTSVIRYSVPQSSNVVIKVFDILGNEIEILVNEEKPIGTYEITWTAENLPSGIYLYQLRAGSYLQTRKMVLMK